ncbi:MAG: Uma2 family endonuclease [Bacteroidota bacterium]
MVRTYILSSHILDYDYFERKNRQIAITHINQLDLEGKYSYADYLTWQVKERLELWRGKIALISPAPNTDHQRISSNLHGAIWSFLKPHHWQIFSAPFDVRFPSSSAGTDATTYTVVQPDLCIVCDPSQLDTKGCLGAPDLVIEILSPGNSTREMRDKYALYEEAGVKEYWIVYPDTQSIATFILNDQGQFVGQQPLTHEDTLETALLPGLKLDLSEVFGE